MPVKIELAIEGTALNVPRFRSKLWAALRRTGIEATTAIKTARTMPVNTGALRQSIGRRDNQAALQVFVGSPLNYAIVMEQGRRPGKRFPPPEPIAQWLVRKGIYKGSSARGELNAMRSLDPREPRTPKVGKRKARASRVPSLGQKALSLAGLTFLVQRKIAEKGSPQGKEGRGHRFFRITSRKVPAQLRRNILAELRRP
jgi:hypothetical protein